LAKLAPFHRSRNSVADALLIEMYAAALASAPPGDHYAFVTSNSDDFSALNGDKRQPHSDLVDHFATDNSTYRLGDAGLEQAPHDEFGDEMAQMIDETYFVEEPRGLSDILAAEKEMFDKVWYERSMRPRPRANRRREVRRGCGARARGTRGTRAGRKDLCR
jgi:hypothetical protein